MGKICCLLGRSASGKDSLYRRLLQEKTLAFCPMLLYTTRPIRENEQDGREYHFVTEEDLRAFADKGKLIERRDYHTAGGLWSYATVDDGSVCPQKANYLVIETLPAFAALRRYYGRETVEGLYIEADEAELLLRSVGRERKQALPNYSEVCRRFLADKADFSEENLRQCGVQKRFMNKDIDACLSEIKLYLSGLLC